MVNLSLAEEFIAAAATNKSQFFRKIKEQALHDQAPFLKNVPPNCKKHLIEAKLLKRELKNGYSVYKRGDNWNEWFVANGDRLTQEGIKRIEFADSIPDIDLEPEKQSTEVIQFPLKPKIRLKFIRNNIKT